jgi:hypothetical protein
MDGAYRRAKDGSVMSPMGAGVAWQHDPYPPKTVKVGGPTASSTRAELAVILLALRQVNLTEALILLVDSTAAIGPNTKVLPPSYLYMDILATLSTNEPIYSQSKGQPHQRRSSMMTHPMAYE